MFLRRALVIVAGAAVVVTFVAPPAHATFSGSNGRIAFERYVPSTNSLEIFSARPDGSGVDRLTTSGQDLLSERPDWSPDGARIAFQSNRVDKDGLADVFQVYVMAWNGEARELRQLTVGPGFQGDPAWSPDGKWLAIEADWGDFPASQGIWSIPSSDADGVSQAEATRVTTSPDDGTFDGEPQFSPDGKWIVFTRFRFEAGRQAIFKVRIDGSQLTRLTDWNDGNSAPDWSPDGKWIAFDSGDTGELGVRGDIWIMDADGRNKTRLTRTARVTETRFEIANNPVWSPDGSRIAYTQWIGDGSVTWLQSIRPDGLDVKVLVKGDRFQNKVDWGIHR